MALIDFDGFDFYADDGSDFLSRRSALQWTINVPSFSSPGRNNQGTCIFLGQRGVIQGAIAASIPSAYLGYGLRIVTPTAGLTRFRIMDGNAIQISIAPNCVSARFDIYRGDVDGTLIGSSANNSISPTAWNYIEAFVTIHPTAGEVILRVNGQEVLHLSGVNTRSTANSTLDGISPCGSSTGGDGQIAFYDDLYLANTTTGPGLFPFNTFVGDVRVITLNPIGNATSTQWTPLSGSNWQMVDDVHNDGDATYNSTATAGNEDLFNFHALIGTISEVLAIQIIGAYRKDDASTREVTQQLVSGGTQVPGTTYSIPGSYIHIVDTFVLNPDTSASWTVTTVNALQAGYVLTA